MTDAGHIDIRLDARDGGRIATLTLANPSRLNAIGAGMMDELIRQAESLAQDQALRAVILTGAGERAFAGGVDIREMAAIDGPQTAPLYTSQNCVWQSPSAVHGLPTGRRTEHAPFTQ